MTPATFESSSAVIPRNQLSDTAQASLLTMARQLDENFPMDSVSGISIASSGPRLSVNAILSNGLQTAMAIDLHVPAITQIPALTLDHRFLPSMTANSTTGIPTAWKRLITYQKDRVWENGVPSGAIADIVPPRLPDLLELEAERAEAGMEYISDYYSSPARPLKKEEVQSLPHKRTREQTDAVLNRIAGTHDISWKRTEGNVVLVRNNRWYRDDLLEAPSQEIERLALLKRALSAPDNSLSKEETALYSDLTIALEMAAHLTLWQIANGLQYYVDEEAFLTAAKKSLVQGPKITNCQPFTDITELCLGYYKTCAFWASLSNIDRKRLLTEGLPLTDLNTRQSSLLVCAFPEASLATNPNRLIKLSHSTQAFRIQRPDIFGNSNDGNLIHNLSLIFVGTH